jgi:hypothetical protein
VSNGIEVPGRVPMASVTEDAKESDIDNEPPHACDSTCRGRGTPTGRTPVPHTTPLKICRCGHSNWEHKRPRMQGCTLCLCPSFIDERAPTPGNTTGGDDLLRRVAEAAYDLHRAARYTGPATPLDYAKACVAVMGGDGTCEVCRMAYRGKACSVCNEKTRALVASLRTELAEARTALAIKTTAHLDALEMANNFSANLDAALKREGEARALAKERHDTANMLFEAAREARERADVLEKALERIAKWDTVGAVYHKHGDGIENCTGPQCIARRALAPVPTAEAGPPTHWCLGSRWRQWNIEDSTYRVVRISRDAKAKLAWEQADGGPAEQVNEFEFDPERWTFVGWAAPTAEAAKEPTGDNHG